MNIKTQHIKIPTGYKAKAVLTNLYLQILLRNFKTQNNRVFSLGDTVNEK